MVGPRSRLQSRLVHRCHYTLMKSVDSLLRFLRHLVEVFRLEWVVEFILPDVTRHHCPLRISGTLHDRSQLESLSSGLESYG